MTGLFEIIVGLVDRLRGRPGLALPEAWWRDIPDEVALEILSAPRRQRKDVLLHRVDAVVAALSEQLRRAGPRIVRADRSDEAGFNRRLRGRWGAAVDAYRLALIVASETGEAVKDRYPDPARHDHRLSALVGLHAQAVLTAREVLSLMSHGYPRAAAARWRTLHELAVTAFVLSGAPKYISRRYLEHAAIQQLKDARQFQVSAGRLGYTELPESELQAMETHKLRLVKRWGKVFAEENGWAAPLFNGRAPRFDELEVKAGIEHLRPYYRLGLHGIHAGSRGLELALFTRGGQTYVLVGPVNAGFAETGHAALISLMHVTVALTLIRTRETAGIMPLVLLRLLDRLVEEAGTALREVELEIDRDEERIELEHAGASKRSDFLRTQGGPQAN